MSFFATIRFSFRLDGIKIIIFDYKNSLKFIDQEDVTLNNNISKFIVGTSFVSLIILNFNTGFYYKG